MLNFIKRRKKANENIDKIPEIIEKLQLQDKLWQEQWSAQKEDYQKLITRQRKNETITEEILETLDEYREELERKNSIRNNEKVFAGYILEYDGSLHQMERILRKSEGKSSEWVQQLHEMRERLHESMKQSELKIIKDSEIAVNFSIHEVVGICGTEDKEKNNLVYEVITPGIGLRGEVLNKAKVTAYKYREREYNEENNRD